MAGVGALVYTTTVGSVFWAKKVEAQSSPRPYVVFVNGYQNCCAWGMNSLQDRLLKMNAEIRYVPYSNFNSDGRSGNTSTDVQFLRDGENFINNQLDGSRPLILIGHSFGGDSILKLLPRIKRRVQFVAVIDPVSTGGVRATLTRFTVPDNVDYFYNRWQDNEPFPIDYKVNGSIRCNARRCDQDKQPFVTHADGQVHRENCRWFETCKKKNRRASHQELATDPWIQRVISDKIGGIVASSNTGISPGLTFGARFRAVSDWAVGNGYISGFPNFHQANYGQGIVFGGIALKPGAAEPRDVLLTDLGNPRSNEELFRAVSDWSVRNGYISGFPNFHQRMTPAGVVFGGIALKPGAAEPRDVPIKDLK